MSYAYDTLSDLTADNVQNVVKMEATIKGGEYHFRGKTYSEWYELAFDAYESWTEGERWGKLFEKIGEALEQIELDSDLIYDYDNGTY